MVQFVRCSAGADNLFGPSQNSIPQYLSPGSRSDTDTDLPGRRLTRAAPNPYSMGTDRREKFLGTRGRWEMERMQS